MLHRTVFFRPATAMGLVSRVTPVHNTQAAADRERIRHNRARVFTGTVDTVRARLDPLLAATKADEVMVTTMIYDHAARRRSYELLARAFGLVTPARPEPAAARA